MEYITREAMQELLSYNGKPAITIYIPVHTASSPPHLRDNQIRFKNLLNKTIGQLGGSNSEKRLVKQLEALIKKSHDNISFWENQTAGLLICASPDFIRMFHLPVNTEEYVAVNSRFHLAPVLSLIEDAKDFYLLILAQHNPKLYKGNMYGLESADTELPINVDTALNIDEGSHKLDGQGFSAGPTAGGSNNVRKGWFSGRGGANDPHDEDRLHFFRLVDNAICRKGDHRLPLLLVGTDSEVAEYRNLSKYPRILDGFIAGNQSETSMHELFTRSLNMVQQELIEPEHASAIAEFTRLSGANPERVAQNEEQLSSAASEGRVDKLLAITYQNTSDNVQDGYQETSCITFPKSSKSAEVLNDIAAQVWQMSGRIINVSSSQLPNQQMMVARLRY